VRESKPQIFTPQEQQSFRDEINAARVEGAYRPGQWSVSPLNRDPAVVGVMPARIRLRDITLRAIEALPGVMLSSEAKAAYLRLLVEAHVPEIVTAGARGRAVPDLAADVELIKGADQATRVTCPLIFTAADLPGPAKAGYDAVQIWVPPWGRASCLYEGGVHATAWQGGDWRTLGLPEDRAGFVARAAELIKRARDLGLEVTAPLLMVSFLSTDGLLDTCAELVAAGVNEIALFDGPGAMSPEALGHLVGVTKRHFPDVLVGVHPHNTFGLSVAAAVAAARAGADCIEVSVNGYCGGPGNADLAAATAAFEAVYGVSTGIRTELLKPLSRVGEELTGYRIAYNHPITGDRVYNWGGMDFMTQEIAVDSLLHNAIAPDWSGSVVGIPVTEVSGPFTMWDKLVELGFDPDRASVERTLKAVMAESRRRGRLLTDEEIRDIASGAAPAPVGSADQ
jgi:isopropylmalate/homocitrate/citramalate synthase